MRCARAARRVRRRGRLSRGRRHDHAAASELALKFCNTALAGGKARVISITERAFGAMSSAVTVWFELERAEGDE